MRFKIHTVYYYYPLNLLCQEIFWHVTALSCGRRFLLTCCFTVDRTFVQLTGWCKFMLANWTRTITVALLPVYQFVIVSERNGILASVAILRRKFLRQCHNRLWDEALKNECKWCEGVFDFSVQSVFSFTLCVLERGRHWVRYEGVSSWLLQDPLLMYVCLFWLLENGRKFRPI